MYWPGFDSAELCLDYALTTLCMCVCACVGVCGSVLCFLPRSVLPADTGPNGPLLTALIQSEERNGSLKMSSRAHPAFVISKEMCVCVFVLDLQVCLHTHTHP